MSTDIVDLIDQQLAEGEPSQGNAYGDPTFPTCPHCARHWHGLPITRRIVQMYRMGRLDPDYVAADDDSPILCDGSTFIGPRRPPPEPLQQNQIAFRILVNVDVDEFRRILARFTDSMIRISTAFSGFVQSYPAEQPVYRWKGHGPKDGLQAADVDVDVEFGPKNWIHELRRMPRSMQFPRDPVTAALMASPTERAVLNLWDQFTAPAHMLVSPGYDFSPFNHRQTTPPSVHRLDGRRATRKDRQL